MDKVEDDPRLTKLMEEIGGRIRARRRELRMTQTQLAALLGVTQHTVVYRTEQGKTNPTVATLFAYADALNMNLNVLMTRARRYEP